MQSAELLSGFPGAEGSSFQTRERTSKAHVSEVRPSAKH